MGKIAHTLFLSCEKATELVEKKQVSKLTCPEKLQLHTHKMMCTACSRYAKQSALIDQALQKRQDDPDPKTLSNPALRDKIKDNL